MVNRNNTFCKRDLDLRFCSDGSVRWACKQDFLHNRHACSVTSSQSKSQYSATYCYTIAWPSQNRHILQVTEKPECILLQAGQGCGGGPPAVGRASKAAQLTCSEGLLHKCSDGCTLILPTGHGAGGGCEGQQGLGPGHGGRLPPLPSGSRNLSRPQA